MKTTHYFDMIRKRPDRAWIQDQWIESVVRAPEAESIQADGRIRPWKRIADAGSRYLGVILRINGETVHNAFFDRSYKP
jgi:hypothetical protein